MESKFQLDLLRRLRRLRTGKCTRALVRETSLSVNDLIAPLFVVEGEGPPQPVEAMPGVFRYSITDLLKECESIAGLGIPAVLLFPCLESSVKSPSGIEALNENTLVLKAIRAIKEAVPELTLIADIALDPYTTHGHDGVLNRAGTDVDNDATVATLGQMALLNAQAGVDWVAPSDMMDGRVGYIRSLLDKHHLSETAVLAYSAKFASPLYGPFRTAVGSEVEKGTYLDKRTYQLETGNRRQALTEALLDEEEGADVLMVKPAGGYLDIIRELRNATHLPIAAYQVSGEYAQIHAAAKMGWMDLDRCRNESLLSIKRAGADMILTYFAKGVAQSLRAQ